MTRQLNAEDLKIGGPQNERYQIPVRVVMNNQTFSVFSNDDYSSNILTFRLKHSSFILSKRNAECFLIKELIPGSDRPKLAKFCPFGLDKTSLVNHEWNYDFNLFKTQCWNEKEVKKLDDEAEVLKDNYQKKIVSF